ncbi:MAG: lipocalin-like domain-containing protein [Chthoniobacteraceae bacterium]
MNSLTKKFIVLLLGSFAWLAHGEESWQSAQPGWSYQFPRDFGPHPDFKTEWWYFTGNLRAPDGHEFGYELTFFRQGVAKNPPPGSCFVVRDLRFAHFTISDLTGGHFYFQEKTSRGAFGEAGFGDGSRLAWIDDWELQRQSDGTFTLHATAEKMAITLQLESQKPPVIHGENGVSVKSSDTSHASCYFSLTRMKTSGQVVLNGQSYAVGGQSWFDKEWASNQLASDQIGWNWFCLQLDDHTELMLYQMRRRDGSSDPASSGTFVAADGRTTHLRADDLQLTPVKKWNDYPIAWQVRIPSLQLEATVTTPLADQELALGAISYWEGATRITGTRRGHAVQGVGYLELTGYRGPLANLQK